MNPSVEPFDETRYKALMDGQECSVIPYSQVTSTATLRYDSDYYKKEYLAIEEYISSHLFRFSSLSEHNLMADASAFYPALEPYYNTGNIPFIRVADVKDEIDYDSCIKIPRMGEEFNTLKLCHEGDIVLTKGGRVGTAGLVTKDSYVTRDLIFINSSLLEREEYVSLYLYYCTKFVQQQMLRSSSMTAQPHLTITLIKNILLYRFSAPFKKDIMLLYDRHEDLLKRSLKQIKDAEDLLGSQLKMSGKPENSIAIRDYSDSYNTSGRLDAEYYQPKYERIIKALNTKETVRSICNKISDDNYMPQEDLEFRYIELANVGNYGDITGVETIAGKNLPSRARRKVRRGQVIISSIEGSLQSCALITDEFDGALCSTGFYVLDSDRINSETLLMLFKSEPIQALLKQRCSGTILTAISKDELLNMPLPFIDEEIQKEIAVKVQESFSLRRKSKELLEYAKHAVEMAIEQGEESAIQWLHSKNIEL